MSANPAPARRWRPSPFIANPWLRYALLAGAALYLALALGSIEVNWARLSDGWARGLRFVSGFLEPNFSRRWDDIVQGMIESLTMTVTSTVMGIAISVPIGIGAARNVVPRPVYFMCRAIIAVSRSLQEIIVAILLVAMVGFGPFAGFLTLSFATIGFLSKLLAEDIEDIDPAPVEAIRATGAPWPSLIAFGVLPQVAPRLLGLSLYRLDINFRESAVVGIVGAGGIGATLNTAIDRYEFDSAAAILILIIAIVMASEYISGLVRGRVK
ncbi:MAG: phosphonate ABC transporter, permease protein PhnE [Rhizobiales bacterium 24-66-13]|uniref:phosphonate ABC transporter, permease protein PhnE n=1 Tax=Roseixanthobacter finlandensis TaxID=3119922 RepID=UPI000BDBC10F|nr:MAG: phosphonate ABC transporter, permease protein PhnE [Rhizobiales bacterium 35-66-30]OYZ81940.1 MAG: phosphonate ABC transporter, permease protein PhnE [Rhizobiales bacterium 24-66-13]OZB10117.1 MAG: phosphonate ABC transporter, permease protein PhnE [Rhizobiales bacterium 39-66-18]HQS10868.1 phosphonate ABC transporter, permease protein PhnE [Xanthobacteraceae bacterium]HQS49561.1 phosphonate ABC transporter, permease protein PhnE [Xanthobacteraceae bacterium]